MPEIRGLISDGQYQVGHFDDSPAVLEFVCSENMPELAALGTSCPDHFLRTKIRPLIVAFDPSAKEEHSASKEPSASKKHTGSDLSLIHISEPTRPY